jgi:hypothetical protein
MTVFETIRFIDGKEHSCGVAAIVFEAIRPPAIPVTLNGW